MVHGELGVDDAVGLHGDLDLHVAAELWMHGVHLELADGRTVDAEAAGGVRDGVEGLEHDEDVGREEGEGGEVRQQVTSRRVRVDLHRIAARERAEHRAPRPAVEGGGEEALLEALTTSSRCPKVSVTVRCS